MKKIFYCCLLFAVPLSAQVPDGGTALSFDGAGSYVSIPHNDVMNVNRLTIEAWMYWEETNGLDVDFLMGKAVEQMEIHTGGGALNNGLRFIPAKELYFDTPQNTITPNQWHHVAMMYDPSVPSAKCYIDGVEKTLTNHGDSLSGEPISVSSNELRLGVRGDNSYSFKGRLDEVRIWNLIRTQQEILDHMSISLTGTEPGLIAYYRMNEGAGGTLTDNSAHGLTGTLVNNVQWVSSGGSMPVELQAFSARVVDGTVTLVWKTATEINNYGFEVQRLESGEWRAVGFIEGKGTTNAPQSYRFSDTPGSGRFHYRLRQIDRDGRSEYSSAALAEIQPTPQHFALEQNYPNPFNPSTTIRFALPEVGRTRVAVHDILGREVALLLDETLEPGMHSVDWNASGWPSGVYYYRIESGHDASVKICVLQK